jgi:predicted amidohydrolase
VAGLTDIARRRGIVVMAGLFERDGDRVYNTYVTVGPEGLLARFRKLHPFVNPHLSPGEEYVVIDLLGCRIGFLICYDNNLPENVRITTMLGAEIIFMPHVTGCLPSVMPGRGLVPSEYWDQRERDPVRLRQEFDGPKGRQWLMRWLPARAYENGVYAVFTNPIGRDGDTIKPGLAMILDPYGEVLGECRKLDEDIVVGLLTEDKLAQSSGRRYLKARRPELYAKLVEPQRSETLPGWNLRWKQS